MCVCVCVCVCECNQVQKYVSTAAAVSPQHVLTVDPSCLWQNWALIWHVQSNQAEEYTCNQDTSGTPPSEGMPEPGRTDLSSFKHIRELYMCPECLNLPQVSLKWNILLSEISASTTWIRRDERQMRWVWLHRYFSLHTQMWHDEKTGMVLPCVINQQWEFCFLKQAGFLYRKVWRPHCCLVAL